MEQQMNNELAWERVELEAKDLVQNILDRAPQYRMNVDGIADAPNDGLDSLTAIPPNCSMEQKYFLVLHSAGHPIGIADVVKDFPKPGTAFLGLFLLQENQQKKGLGLKGYELLENLIRNELCCNKIRLAVVDSNPVQPFWEKLGFVATGEVRPHDGVDRKSLKRVMEKRLAKLTEVFSVRPATLSDIEGIAKVHVDTWRTAYSGIMPQSFLDSLKYENRERQWKSTLEKMEPSTTDCRLVVESPESGIVGFVAGGKPIHPHTSFTGELYAVYVLKTHQRFGFGRKLTAGLVKWLIANSFNDMYLWVLEENLATRCFYESIGGQLLPDRKEENFEDKKLIEVAYGWHDLPRTLSLLTRIPDNN
jgi:GNAT superfamily N-acetyltransferase